MSTAFPQPFGKYTLVSRLGVGGMAITYRAKEKLPGGGEREVAVKCMLPHLLQNPRFLQLFIDEARTAVRLDHPNIAKVTDFGDVNGQLYLAMEFVHGQSLAHVLDRARKLGARFLPVPETLWMGCLACEALHYAHTLQAPDGRPAGIVHRDVSPQNLIASYDGVLKLIDFGIAQALARTTGGEVQHVSGKYRYASPEQARGEPVDQRADIYATGVVLYELLTGRRPYDGERYEVALRSASRDFPDPSSLNPALSRPVARVILQALSPSANGRYPTAKAMVQDLYAQLVDVAPEFDPRDLRSFMRFLFEAELAKEKLPTHVPVGSLTRYDRWLAESSAVDAQG